ncbi:unnamed protein product [Owenia fusiformis]|uniref:Importin N-terminal domain-containing protein n=1 Tax=Owenia fusiformis TaxID=6347 RepID=A0A8S4PVN7_OWEFU|nr:unnamed protein product [Owenia fusiformis]
MASDEASLRALEGLMTEFFHVQTTNERKRQIEELLNNFSQQKDAWRHCLFYMANTGNEYVMMYCMTVLENLINKQWIGQAAEHKNEMRATLNQFLLSQHNKVPTFVRNKLVLLVVNIGRIDWPHFYPDFFSNILQLIQEQETAALGIILLQTASEELACPREDLSIARKEELRRLLLAQIPTVLGLLNGVLEAILERHRHLVTATPPPSPTHGQSAERGDKNLVSLFSTSPHAGSILSNMFKSPSGKDKVEHIPPLDETSHQLSVLSLSCLAHLFSWIPLSSMITPSLLSTIFHFAEFGCEHSARTSPSNPNSSFSTMEQSLGVLAMNCVNELLSKNCVPQEFEDFLLQMFHQTFNLLQRLTKETSMNSTGNRLADLEEDYVEKFTEFLRLFVSIHLRRFESNSHFPVIEFLSLFFKYTFKQPTQEGFYACLDIWTVFLDYLQTKLATRDAELETIISMYKEALLSLASQIMQRFQFRYNQSQLEELDDETLDDDSQTEWQQFLRHCLEVIARISELMPAPTFTILFEPFQENLQVYLGLEQYIDNGTTRRLTIAAENECRRLHCSLRDLSSFLQSLGRLAEHFIGELFTERFTDAQTLVERLIHVCAYGSKLKLFEIHSSAQSVLQADFIEVHAQALAALKAYSHWLAQFGVESGPEPAKVKFQSLVSAIVDCTVPLISKQIPDKIVQSASHLLLSVMTTIRPPFLLTLPTIQHLYTSVSQGLCEPMSQEVQLLVYRSLSNYLLLPWPNMSEAGQNWPDRSANHSSFIKQLTSAYRQLKDTNSLANSKTLQTEAVPCVQKTLEVLTDIINSISEDGVSNSKKICYQSLQDLVQTTLTMFPIYIHHPEAIDSMLAFFLALFQSLRVQMGVPFTEQTIQTFMNMFTRQQLADTILHESNTGHKIVEKFLSILQVIVGEPGSNFKRFLSSIISICMDQIYPVIAERPSPDIKPTLFELLFNILFHNWRYFFKGTVLTALHSKTEEMQHQEQFVAIMQSFGQSFLQPDIGVFKQNLETLEKLNTKWKLYHKHIYAELAPGRGVRLHLKKLRNSVVALIPPGGADVYVTGNAVAAL